MPSYAPSTCVVPEAVVERLNFILATILGGSVTETMTPSLSSALVRISGLGSGLGLVTLTLT